MSTFADELLEQIFGQSSVIDCGLLLICPSRKCGLSNVSDKLGAPKATGSFIGLLGGFYPAARRSI